MSAGTAERKLPRIAQSMPAAFEAYGYARAVDELGPEVWLIVATQMPGEANAPWQYLLDDPLGTTLLLRLVEAGSVATAQRPVAMADGGDRGWILLAKELRVRGPGR